MLSLSARDFHRLSNFIHAEAGIRLPEAKKIMLEGRLTKRLRALKLSSFAEYCDFLFSPQGLKDEAVHLVDVVTTNKTDFFREAVHFDFLTRVAVPDLVDNFGAGVGRRLAVWSAGCSTGEEPYTLAMVLSEVRQRRPERGFRFVIVATDISTQVLKVAERAIYPHDRVEPIPLPLRKKYLLKSRDEGKDLVRIAAELRSLVHFGRLNLMNDEFSFREQLDVIFCRNVLIYFGRATQEKLLHKFYRQLNRGGYLFLGHSESLQGNSAPLVQVAPTIYRRLD